MPGRTIPFRSTDEAKSFTEGSRLAAQNGFTGYWHGADLGTYTEIIDYFDHDFVEISVAPNTYNAFTLLADLLLIKNIPGEYFGQTGKVTYALPEVLIQGMIIFEQVILPDGSKAYYRVAEAERMEDDFARDYPTGFWGLTKFQVEFRAEDSRFVPRSEGEVLYRVESGKVVVVGDTLDYKGYTTTGRYFAEIVTQESTPEYASNLAGTEVILNGRYVLMENAELGETLEFGFRTDAWGSSWLQTIEFAGTPPTQTPSISVSDAREVEGSVPGATQLLFEVRLSAPSATPVSVQYFAANGTATVGTDFQSALGTLTFAPGETVRYVEVNVIRDFQTESDETVELQLEKAVGATIADAVGLGTIVNDDDGKNSIVSPFQGAAGFTASTSEPEHLRSATKPATYDSSSGFYSAGGLTFNDFEKGAGGIVLPAATAILQELYKFAVNSTAQPVRDYLKAWLNTAEVGSLVQDHQAAQTESAFRIAEALVADDKNFDVDAELAQIEDRYKLFQRESTKFIGDQLSEALSDLLRFGVQHSDIAFQLDLDARATKAVIVAEAGHHDVWLGSSGADKIYLGDLSDAAWGGAGDDVLHGEAGDDNLAGGDGNDSLHGGLGVDILSGGFGSDTFLDTAAGLSSDTITDFSTGDRIVISDAKLTNFSFSLTGSTLLYTGGSLTLSGGANGVFVASGAAEGGVQLTFASSPPAPPTRPSSRARLILTEAGQDLTVGGNIAVNGTTAGAEVIQVVRGNVLLDASYNFGGDTVVLPANASSYAAILNGSEVTIYGGDVTVTIPIGIVGISVQFADSTRQLRFDVGTSKVMLGAQAITNAQSFVAGGGPALSDPVEVGPDKLARLILTEAGQDVQIGGRVQVVGTNAPGETVQVLGGTIVLDGSFNSGGDTAILAGLASAYTARLLGSVVTIFSADASVAIPVGTAGLTVTFDNGSAILRIEPVSGKVLLGNTIITTAATSLASLAMTATGGEDFFHSAGLPSDTASAATGPMISTEHHGSMQPFTLVHSDNFAFA